MKIIVGCAFGWGVGGTAGILVEQHILPLWGGIVFAGTLIFAQAWAFRNW